MKKFLIVICSLFLVCGCATSHLENGEESVVKFEKDGISAQELYDKLKETYGAEVLVNLIDSELLSREYKANKDENTYVRQVIESLKNEWGENFEANIQNYYNVKTEDALEDYIRLTYRRNLWKTDYAEDQVNETQINDYYENNTVGDMEISHILITSSATSGMSDDEKKAAEDKAYQDALNIIERLNNNESFESLAKENTKDEATKSTGGKLPEKINDRSSYDENFLDASIKLEVGKYTTTPVKSQYGYHIIYKTSQGDKPALKDIEKDIISKIAQDLINADSNFNAKSLLGLREKYGIKITDSVLEKDYNKLYGL